MNCATCGAEHHVLRDEDDNLYRRLCECERSKSCHACTKGIVVSANLSASGEVSSYACKRHGNPGARAWGEAPKAEAHQPSAKDNKPAKASKPDRAQKAAENPNDVKAADLPVYACRCPACERHVLSTQTSLACTCGEELIAELIQDAALDHYSVVHGNGRTSVIMAIILRGDDTYVPDEVRVAVPRE